MFENIASCADDGKWSIKTKTNKNLEKASRFFASDLMPDIFHGMLFNVNYN